MPVSVATIIFSRSGIVNLLMAFRSPERACLERLRLLQRRFLGRQRWYAVEAIHHLTVHRVLDPQRAVLIESCDALVGRNEVWTCPVGSIAPVKPRIACFAAPSFHDGSGTGQRSGLIRDGKRSPQQHERRRRHQQDPAIDAGRSTCRIHHALPCRSTNEVHDVIEGAAIAKARQTKTGKGAVKSAVRPLGRKWIGTRHNNGHRPFAETWRRRVQSPV